MTLFLYVNIIFHSFADCKFDIIRPDTDMHIYIYIRNGRFLLIFLNSALLIMKY